MRVLYVSHSYPLPDRPLSNVGGMQRLAVDLGSALSAHPELTLIPRVLETSWRWTGLRTGPFLAGLLRDLPAVVRRERIDLVLFSSMVTASVALPLRRRIAAAGARTAAIPVGRDVTLPNPVYQRLVPRVLGSLDLVLPISRATAEACLARGAAPERTRVVPCGIHPDRFPLRHRRPEARRELLRSLGGTGSPLPPDALLVCSVGRHQERKGFHWFVDQVMPRLPAGVVYLLAGSGPTTPAVEAAVRRHGLQERVRLLGQISDEALELLYCGCDLFAMPNLPVAGDMEGFGVVMLEAGVCGLPILAADLEGIRDVVHEGQNGHRLPSGDAPAFAAAIRRFRDHPERLPGASRAAARATVARFAWPAVADRYAEAFGSIPTRRGRRSSAVGRSGTDAG